MSVYSLTDTSRIGFWISATILHLFVLGCGKPEPKPAVPAQTFRTANPVQSPAVAAPSTVVAGESIEVRGTFSLSVPDVRIGKVLVEIVRPRRDGGVIIENTSPGEVTKLGDSEYEYAVELGVPEKLSGEYQLRVTAGTPGFSEKFAAGEQRLTVQPRPPGG